MKNRINYIFIIIFSCAIVLLIQYQGAVVRSSLGLREPLGGPGAVVTIILMLGVLVLSIALPNVARLGWAPLLTSLLGFGAFLGLSAALQRNVFPADWLRLGEWAMVVCYGVGWASLAWGLTTLAVGLIRRLPRGESKAIFVKQNEDARRLVVFVHGLTGDAETTWGRFPTLIAGDPRLTNYDVFLWGYPTKIIGKMPDIWQAATQLETELRVRLDQYEAVVLVGHSLGGLLIRAMIIDALLGSRLQAISKINHVITFSTPNDGAELANIASLFHLKSAQLDDLDIGGDTVNKLRAEWINRVYAPTIRPGEELAKKKIPLTAVVGLEDRIVTFNSARSFFQDPEPETVPGDHIDMKLPKDRDATCYLVLLRVLKHHDDPADALQLLQRYATGATRTVPKRPAGKRFRLIGFDADGTLLRGDGFQYSWSLVWKHLGVPDAVWKAARRTFLEKGRTFAAYQEWCAHDLQHLKMRGLRREDFKAITSSIHPTHYLRETIGILRSEGFTLAIISGGIDTFLYEIIPDTKELFDYVCINSFHYDDRGIISAIDPSPFDFIGKADALKALCKYHGAELSESVFVGEGYNDGAVGEVAGLCIAYPPDSEDITAPARVEITEDDLRKILDHVL